GDPLTAWTLRWSFTAGQTITQFWNANVTQSGAAVTATNVSWNGGLATNGTAAFGFNANWNGSANPAPASFTVNGVACTGAPVTSAPPTSAGPSASRSASPSP